MFKGAKYTVPKAHRNPVVFLRVAKMMVKMMLADNHSVANKWGAGMQPLVGYFINKIHTGYAARK